MMTRTPSCPHSLMSWYNHRRVNVALLENDKYKFCSGRGAWDAMRLEFTPSFHDDVACELLVWRRQEKELLSWFDSDAADHHYPQLSLMKGARPIILPHSVRGDTSAKSKV